MFTWLGKQKQQRSLRRNGQKGERELEENYNLEFKKRIHSKKGGSGNIKYNNEMKYDERVHWP